MPFETLNLGIDLTLPTSGTNNWGVTLKNTTWTNISSHDHTGSGAGVKLTGSSMTDNSVTGLQLSKNLNLTQATTLVPVGTVETVDWDNGNIQEVDLGSATGNVTLTLSNPIKGASYLLFLIQGATARTVIWPASVKWPQGQEAILSTVNTSVDYIEFYYDGADYRSLRWDLDIK